jgi:hypothetical protein
MDNRQGQLAGMDAGKPLTWYRYGPACGRRYQLQIGGESAGLTIIHCGHPTANWPYYIEAEWLTEIVVMPNGRGFPRLAPAKEAALALYHKRGEHQCTFTF